MMEQALYHQYIGGTVPVPPFVMRYVMLAAPALIDRLMTNNWAGESEKGNRIIPRWRPNKKRKDIYHHSPRPISIICQLPDPLISHWSLPLKVRADAADMTVPLITYR